MTAHFEGLQEQRQRNVVLKSCPVLKQTQAVKGREGGRASDVPVVASLQKPTASIGKTEGKIVAGHNEIVVNLSVTLYL